MIIILSITAAKDALEDVRRHQSDKTINNYMTQTLTGEWFNVNSLPRDGDNPPSPKRNGKVSWEQTTWRDVQVGDFVLLHEDEGVPADILILATSDQEGLCYVETKNLDGETNLKIRQCISATSHLKTPEDCANCRFVIDSEPPTNNLFTYNATMRLSTSSKKVPINLNSILLRGCNLRQTDWVIGMVVFTGDDTKVRMNAGKTPSKRSQIEQAMNPQVIVNLVFLAAICIVCAIGYYYEEQHYLTLNTPWVMLENRPGDNSLVNSVFAFFNALVLFQNIVPISLVLTIEIARTAQAYFIYMDGDMFDDDSNTPTTARSWNLSDDLGQIEYLFSDKTGTLTQNVMEFRSASIGGKLYEGQVSASMPTDSVSDFGASSVALTSKPKSTAWYNGAIMEDLQPVDGLQSRSIAGFFTVLSVCHTVLISEDATGKTLYKSQSPDEGALVQAAADMGFVFKGRELNSVRISTPLSDVETTFELLNVLEFTSARKRMSVIVRNAEDGRIILLTKGADNVILDRVGEGQEDLKRDTLSQLETFAKEGLRTLCLAYSIIEPEQYDEWSAKYHEAETSLTDRDAKIEEAAALIENNLMLLGATAIEDRLQDGVPECIELLRHANIKIWVLTGDKLETAISIASSTRLIARDMALILIRSADNDKMCPAYEQMRVAKERYFDDFPDGTFALSQVEEHGASISEASSMHKEHGFELRRTVTGHSVVGVPAGGYALVIDGLALKQALEEPHGREMLLDLACRCQAVVCCRVSPKQKAEVVKLVRYGKKAVTLAIGDGANDVSMIQEAHVGVGISGQEGMQAVNSADYGIAQFRFLSRLLLVHGHWSFVRNAEMILNFFYKNAIGVGILFLYQFLCAFSTTSVIDWGLLLVYNLIYTSLPVIAMGCFDRDVSDRVALEVPQLYRIGIRQELYNLKQFGLYMLDGLWQSAACMLIPLYTYWEQAPRRDGRNPEMLEVGVVMIVSNVIVATLFNGMNTQQWTRPVILALSVEIAVLFAYIAVYTLVPPSFQPILIYGFDLLIFPSGLFWLSTILAVTVSLLPRYLVKFSKRMLAPRDVHIIQEICKRDKDHDFIRDPLMVPGAAVAMRARGQKMTKSSAMESRLSLHEMDSLNAGSQVELGLGTPLARQSSRSTFNTDITVASAPAQVGLMDIDEIDDDDGATAPLQRVTTAGAVFDMQRGGQEAPNYGYAFSQNDGIGEAILARPILRRRRTQPVPTASAAVLAGLTAAGAGGTPSSPMMRRNSSFGSVRFPALKFGRVKRRSSSRLSKS